MVADDHEADAATKAFTEYWEGAAALAGSTLVYNTGRSLGQFVSLMQQKNGALALPDVLITAVGTKVGSFKVRGNNRMHSNIRHNVYF